MVNRTKQNNHQFLKNATYAKTITRPNPLPFLDRIPLPTGIQHWIQARSFKRAVSRAYRQFAQQHDQWVDSFFDEYFVEQHTPRLLDHYRQNNRLTMSTELAKLWADQFSPGSLPRKHVGEARAIAEIFLGLIEVEL